ncbi:MAG: peroxiredoxin [Candidatus Obscuribacterales bacterium]|nr:peroxiredoxin [Candidatus Obscuribacterales bacterium]
MTRIKMTLGLSLLLLIGSAVLSTDHCLAAWPKKAQKSEANIDKKADKMAGQIKVNDQAPDLALPDQSGKTIALKDFHGQKVVVLYFYPKDQTSVCTAEACTFRDSYEQFKDLGAEVIGVSGDSIESHKKFAEKNHLPFSLLADTSNMARKAFGVPNTAGILPGRVTYVIDKNGVVRYLFNSMMDGPKHVQEALKIVKELAQAKDPN